MPRVGFTFTKGAADLLVNMAREYMFMDLDPEKAVKTITDVLIGCNRDNALQIIKGSLVINVDESGTVYAIEAKTCDSIIGIRPMVGGIANKCCEDMDNAMCLIRGISHMINDGYVSLDIPWLSIVDSLMDNELKLSLNDIHISGKNYETISTVINEAKRVRTRAIKTIGLARFVNDNYKLFEDNVDDALFERLKVKIRNLEETISNPDCVTPFVKEYVENEREINKKLVDFFNPCDITKGYDAGWLAPNGDFYGLNGSRSNLLHMKISDKLKEQGTIKYSEDRGPDLWMEINGWMRIAGNQIFFGGMMLDSNNHVTREQVDKLILYADTCCNGMLGMGYKGHIVKSVKLKQMDLLMVDKLLRDV